MRIKHNMIDARGAVPESWACIDCGVNTAPGIATREQIKQALMIHNDKS
jgi:hypothetical protein